MAKRRAEIVCLKAVNKDFLLKNEKKSKYFLLVTKKSVPLHPQSRNERP